ncbi:bifunctional 3'-5' exonuclease/DNA polymerase [Arthrobacter castelli]|uniref:bifunctional 3'-5' exonuclease/DNA polymerase n=1 Tax=Arthrobacter castelli TaxID=271431 RepID=UPI00040FB002|nr:bifunctional 3'-5' exonuclease/DNA polymerase [Arthrobacter castelli]
MYLILGRLPHGTVDPASIVDPAGDSAAPDTCLLPLNDDGSAAGKPINVHHSQLPAIVRQYEQQRPRWVFEETRQWYPELLAHGVTIERCHDLSLAGAILAASEFTSGSRWAAHNTAQHPEALETDRDLAKPAVPAPKDQYSLFEQAPPPGAGAEELAGRLRDQLEAVQTSSRRSRTQLLVAAESAGALVAAEMQHAGLPWRVDIHEQILAEALGPRPAGESRPEKLEQLAVQLRDLLNAPGFNPDSPQELMRALHRAGIEVKTTRQWELERQQHPAIEPLLLYKKLSRLFAANGWAWLDAWVHRGRFRPEYIVGGVVTGRWASRGGGALQIPKVVRSAARADPGHRLVVADAAQLEPRVLAALARDDQLAAAARGQDLYAGISAQGFGERASAKVAVLGAMYGSTTGESGRLMPQLARMYPAAVGFVEHAAQTGQAGGTVSSFLGRSSPEPSNSWRASQMTTSAAEQQRADNMARTRGRFTRNFVVQATAAEWALCWLAELRRRLRASRADSPDESAAGELVFFLHDEVVVHAPAARADEAAGHVKEAAAAATRLMFGEIPIEFAVQVMTVESYADTE